MEVQNTLNARTKEL